MSMKKSNDTIGNRTRDLPTCSPVPQPTALPRAPQYCRYGNVILVTINLQTKANIKIQGRAIKNARGSREPDT